MVKSTKQRLGALAAAPLVGVLIAGGAAAAPETCNWKTARDLANAGDYAALCDCAQVTPSFLERLQRRSDFETTLSVTGAQCPGLATLLTDLPTASLGTPFDDTRGEDRSSDQVADLGNGNPGGGGGNPGDGGGDPGNGGSDPGSGGGSGNGGGSGGGHGSGNGGGSGGPGNGNGNNGNPGNGGGNTGGSGPGTGNGGGNNGQGGGDGKGGGKGGDKGKGGSKGGDKGKGGGKGKK